MNALDLDAIRARMDAATPGPWRLVTDSCDCEYPCGHGQYPHAIRLPEHTVYDGEKPCDPSDSLDSYRHQASEIPALTMETAEFIAHSREDVEALLAEVERLRRIEAMVQRFADSPVGCGREDLRMVLAGKTWGLDGDER